MCLNKNLVYVFTVLRALFCNQTTKVRGEKRNQRNEAANKGKKQMGTNPQVYVETASF